VEKTRSQSRLQFSLRSLLIVALISAICIGNWQFLFELSARYFYPFAALLTVGAWWVARLVRSHFIGCDSLASRFSILRVSLPIAILMCLLSLWLRYRWLASFRDDAWPRPFPYPDEVLLVFHDWLDAKYPSPGRYIKIHGEFYTVWQYLDLATLGLCALVGTVLGLRVANSVPLVTDVADQQRGPPPPA
jgi:hypothetical protein